MKQHLIEDERAFLTQYRKWSAEQNLIMMGLGPNASPARPFPPAAPTAACLFARVDLADRRILDRPVARRRPAPNRLAVRILAALREQMDLWYTDAIATAADPSMLHTVVLYDPSFDGAEAIFPGPGDLITIVDGVGEDEKDFRVNHWSELFFPEGELRPIQRASSSPDFAALAAVALATASTRR